MLSRKVCYQRWRWPCIATLSRKLSSYKPYAGNNTLAIVREDYGIWERRAPLSPDQVKFLVSGRGTTVIVQPCAKRIYPDSQYRNAGAVISEDISPASTVVGIKQMSPSLLRSDKTYLFFSHVMKAQPANLPILDKVLERKARLIDYECITELGSDVLPRLVTFGRFAGMAGMTDALQGLGLRLLVDGYSNPFLNIPLTYMCDGVHASKMIARNVGTQLRTFGLPISDPHSSASVVCPWQPCLVFAFAGTGNVSKGAREIFEQLPHQYVTIDELPYLADRVAAGKLPANRLYAVIFDAQDVIRKHDGSRMISKAHYYSHPDEYRAVFHEKVAPYINVLVNGMYWDDRYPRLLTREQLKTLRSKGNQNLKVVADVSCDLEGGIEFLSHCTTMAHPFYTYFPEIMKEKEGVHRDGVLVLGLDTLPTELPKEASEAFGKALLPLLPSLLDSKGSATPADMSDLPPELRRACIASHGELLPRWSYIARLREQEAVLKSTTAYGTATTGARGDYDVRTTDIEITGHLFDSGLINTILDLLENRAASAASAASPGSQDSPSEESLDASPLEFSFSVATCDVQPKVTYTAVPSRIILQLSGSEETVTEAVKEIAAAVEARPSAEGSVTIEKAADIDYSAFADIRVRSPKRVLLLGSGHVAKPLVRLLAQHENVHLTIASDSAEQAKGLIEFIEKHGSTRGHRRNTTATIGSATVYGSRAVYHEFVSPRDNFNGTLETLMRNCDVVVSLLPANMHIPIAQEAIRQGRHMVTASFVNPLMSELHESASKAGVVLLNEMGLDPGIDHMMIMKAIDDIHQRGGQVTEVVSLCGGLPDPAAADNPMRYKISWSPLGMLRSAKSAARYMKDGEVIIVNGDKLLTAACPSFRFPTMRLEAIPNRDSLMYRDVYDIPSVRTLCRGTLRYEGTASIMQAFKYLGLLDDAEIPISSWRTLLELRLLHLRNTGHIVGGGEGFTNLAAAVRTALQAPDSGVSNVDAAMKALYWLGILQPTVEAEGVELKTNAGAGSSSSLTLDGSSPIVALSNLLEKRLSYGPGEKDMVAMFHTVVGEMPDGSTERHTSRLLAFGDPAGDSAMSATVGYTAGAAVELILGLNPSTAAATTARKGDGGSGGGRSHTAAGDDNKDRLRDSSSKGKDRVAQSSLEFLHGRSGILLPTIPSIYEPVLARLRDCGISWTESVEVMRGKKKHDSQDSI